MGKQTKQRVVITRGGKKPPAPGRDVWRDSVKARKTRDLTQPVLEPAAWEANR